MKKDITRMRLGLQQKKVGRLQLKPLTACRGRSPAQKESEHAHGAPNWLQNAADVKPAALALPDIQPSRRALSACGKQRSREED